MGNSFEITVVRYDQDRANEKINLAVAEIQPIEKFLTTVDDIIGFYNVFYLIYEPAV